MENFSLASNLIKSVQKNVNKLTVVTLLNNFHRLACRCAQRSRQDGYTYFGLQDYGRCFSAPHAASSYNKYGSSNRCSNQHYQNCDDNAWGECVGKAKEVNYVYQIVEGTYLKRYYCISIRSSSTLGEILNIYFTSARWI